ncbi:MAG TPA: hypothetical protein VLA75_10625 [Thermoanaerobaculia bacterium]|nr:hypothetical protein [Thermoanaerobaculia bacterium]
MPLRPSAAPLRPLAAALLAFAAAAPAAATGALAGLPLLAGEAIAVARCERQLTGEALPSDAELERSGARVGAIHLRAANIFDPSVPGEDFWGFRIANRLHLPTREEIVRRRLLIAPGDPYEARRLAESERLLRAERYLYEATVRPDAYCGGQVDVAVVTRDVWSLKLSAGFNRKGGENDWHVTVQEANFLGLGKDLTVSRSEDVDRTSTLLRYRDLDFLARRLDLEAAHGHNSDGRFWRLDLARPFYSLDTRWSAGGRWWDARRVESRYRLGEIEDRYQVEEIWAELGGGRSAGLRGGHARRLRFGTVYDRHRFTALPGEPLARPLPENRELLYPWVALEWVEEEFVELANLDRIHRVEDLNLGRQANAWLGLAAKNAGSDRDAALFGASWGEGFSGRGGLLLAGASLSGRLERAGLRHGLASARLRYYRRTPGDHLFHATLQVDLGHRLDADTQLLLGGDSGLRGYPLRYQEGNRRVLLTVEQRFFHDRELFHLVRLGAAVFVDVGKAWTAGEPGPESLGLLRDVGIGLRLGSSRSASAAMVHLDVAWPLDGPQDVRRVQWLVTTRETF